MAGTRRVIAAVAAAAIATVTLVGCGSDGGSDGTSGDTSVVDTTTEAPPATDPSDEETDPDTTTSTTVAAEPDRSTTTAVEDGDEGVDTETSVLDSLPDGTHHGYIAGVEKGMVEGQAVQVIIWDEVELLTGDAADAAAAAAGDESPVPNDYYIVNDEQTVRRLAVVPDASVSTLVDGGSELVPSSVTDVAKQDHLFEILVGNVRDITTVSSIQAVYLP